MKFLVPCILILQCQVAIGQLLSVNPVPDRSLLAVGEQVEISVLVADQRQDAPGILSAFLDLNYDESLLQVIPDSFSLGPNFGALGKHDLSLPGIVDESGAFVTGILSLPPVPSGIGGQPELLYSVSFEAIAAGESVITTNHADILPLNATTLFGIDDGVTEAEIAYGSARVTLVPEPDSQPLLLLALAFFAATMRMKQQ